MLEGAETLREDGVREVVAGVDPVGIHGAEVLHLQLDEGLGEFLGVTKTNGEGVGFILEFAREDVHEKLDDGVERGQDVVEDEEADNDRLLLEESESVVNGGVVDESREESKEPESVELMRLATVEICAQVKLT